MFKKLSMRVKSLYEKMVKSVYTNKIKPVYDAKIKKHMHPVTNNTIINMFIIAVAVNLIVECFSRKSIFKGFVFLFTRPHIFIYGVLIIMLTLSVGLVLRRRYFWYVLLSVLWIAGGVVNFIVLSARITPFTFTEIVLLADALAVWHLYYSKFKMFLMVSGIVLAIIAIIICWFALPKYKGKLNRIKGIVVVAIMSILVYGMTFIYLQTGIVKSSFGNIANAYLDYGFTYCFSGSIINRGVQKPKGYSAEIIEQITNGILANQDKNPSDKVEDIEYPNIIFVQLESLFDPTRLKGVELSKDPVPFLRKLRSEYPSGLVSVPSFGAGTANTEVELIIGMNIEDFGTGEYPYKTIFNKQVCESTAFNLRELGFTAHAIHNNTAGFYSRNVVFSNLGFDTFTPIELISNYEKTSTGWAKDDCLIGAITDCLDYSDGVDYVYTISVQGHGNYPGDYNPELMPIEVSNFPDANNESSFRYYVNQIAEMDQFVENLVKELSKRDEKTMVVFFGDHLPTFELDDTDMKEGSVFQTEYVIWNNFDLPKVDKDVEAFQLTAHALSMVDISQGTLIKFHQTASESEDYLENLQQLEYDMLHGDHYVYNGKLEFEATDLRFGVRDINIKGLAQNDGEVWVFGENFTKYSNVYINNVECEAEFYSDFLLKVKDYELKEGDKVKIVQRHGSVFFFETEESVY